MLRIIPALCLLVQTLHTVRTLQDLDTTDGYEIWMFSFVFFCFFSSEIFILARMTMGSYPRGPPCSTYLSALGVGLN